ALIIFSIQMPRLFHHLGYTNSHTPRFIPEPYQCILEPQMPRHHQGKYKRQSEYEENLNYIIDHISSTQKFPDGFTHTSRGEAPNFVTIVFQCRATPTVPSVVLAMPPPSQGFVGDVKDTREQLYESFNKKTRDFLYNLMLKADKPKSR
ncbi:hypothetical protein ISN44_As03g023010, partial [Arabidopsis suecica]